MIKKVCFGILHLLLVFIISCNWMNGEYSLGNHLSLWDNDKKEERVIVYCEGDCNGGIYVVPTYERHYDSAKRYYTEYVKEVAFDKKWVIAKTFKIKENIESYYIISKNFNIENLDCSNENCDSILQSHVIGPLSLMDFKNELQRLDIRIYFH